MDRRRSAKVVTALCGTVVLAGGFAAWLGGFGSAVLDNPAVAVIEQRAVLLAANVDSTAAIPVEQPRAALPVPALELADAPQPIPADDAAVVNTDVAAVAESEMPIAVAALAALEEPTAIAAPDEPSIVVAALSDPSQILPAEPPVQVATANIADPAPDEVRQAVSRIEIVDECLVVDVCIDRFLWALYQRTLKEDTIKVHDSKKVTVKRRGKMVTVTRSFTRLVNENFAWKDPKAAEKVGMEMMDYVIGGMDRSFKTKLFHTLYAAEQAGLSPGITSAFRDDYRQSIASGLKAATGKSYHGGSSRGGYGHGLAADVVSVAGATRGQRWVATEAFWKWIDAHGKEFGIGRPYLGRDPPHVAPVDGREYASHNGGTKTRHAALDNRKHKRLAMRDDRSPAKTLKKRKVAETPVHTTRQQAVTHPATMAMATPAPG